MEKIIAQIAMKMIEDILKNIEKSEYPISEKRQKVFCPF